MMRRGTLGVLTALGLWLSACSGDPSAATTNWSPTSESVGSTTPSAAQTPTPFPTSLRIVAVGDVMLARDLVTLMDEHGSGYPYARVADLLRSGDITIANLEGTFTDRGTAAAKFYTFRAPPAHAAGLAAVGIDIVTLGNNHTMDFGATGLRDTLAALDRAGIRHAGAGLAETAARMPVVIEANGLRVAFLSVNGVGEATFADGDSPGVARAAVDTLAADVAAARELADFVVVAVHAGAEYTARPTEQQRSLAHAAIDAGASLVLGHHPHSLQGIERYGEGWIAYSLGNFVFDLDADDLATLGPGPFETVVLSVVLSRDSPPQLSFEPVLIDVEQNRPVIPSAERSALIRARLDGMSAALR